MNGTKRLFLSLCLFGCFQLIGQEVGIPAQELYKNTWSIEHIRQARLLHLDTIDLDLITSETPEFSMPVKNFKIISPYGKRGSRGHAGIDLKQRPKDSIFAVFDGMVRMAKPYSGYGNLIVVRHANGLETLYSHLSELFVKPEQMVKSGEVIGLAGRTGRASTEHLHFEIRFLYEPIAPNKVIDFDRQCLVIDKLRFCKGRLKQPTDTLDSDDFMTVEPSDTTLILNEELVLEPSSQNHSKTHKIQRGETLYSLAKRYNTTVEKLCEWNYITDVKHVVVGREILVSKD